VENALIEIAGLAKCLQLLSACRLPKLTLSMAPQMRYLFNATSSNFSIVQSDCYPGYLWAVQVFSKGYLLLNW